MGATAGTLTPSRTQAAVLDALVEGLSAGFNGRAQGQSNRQKVDAQHQRLASAEVDAGSAQAEHIFRSRGLSMDSNGFDLAARQADYRGLLEALRGWRQFSRPDLNFAQASLVGEELIPWLVRLDETYAHEEMLADGRVYVPANSAVKVNYAGYCMDQSLPAPHAGDRLRLLPLSLFTDEKTAAAMAGLAKFRDPANRNSSSARSVEVQSLVWALRAMQRGESSALSDRQRRILAHVAPQQFGSGRNFLDEIARDLAACRT